MKHIESRIQQECIRWFRLQYPRYYYNLFSVPNGGARTKIEGKILKAEGTVAGVSDLILLFPSKDYHGVCIEMKTGEKTSRQSMSQKEFQRATEEAGYQYVVIRSFDEFKAFIDNYLKAI